MSLFGETRGWPPRRGLPVERASIISRGLLRTGRMIDLTEPFKRCGKRIVAPRPVSLLERGMKVRVICYEGYRAEETPRAFLLGERRIEVVRVLDRWRGEDHEYVKLDGSDGVRYILRYDRSRDEWEIQMMESPPSTG